MKRTLAKDIFLCTLHSRRDLGYPKKCFKKYNESPNPEKIDCVVNLLPLKIFGRGAWGYGFMLPLNLVRC